MKPSPHAPSWFVLPPAVQELLRCCFEDAHAEPDLRPTAAQWQHALEEAEYELTTCATNAQHVYHRGLDRCPWCVLAQQHGRDPFPDPATIRAPRPTLRTNKVKGEKEFVLVEDPLPPKPSPPPVSSAPGGMEIVLQAIGASVERRSWLLWLGVALIGSVAGLLYALQRALPGKPHGL